MLASPHRDTPPPLAAQLFGGFAVRGGSVVLGPHDVGGAKPRQLLEVLLVFAGTTVSKDRLVEVLWPERAPRQAVATLESYVSLLRSRLRRVAGERALIRTGVRGYRIEREDVDVDLHLFDVLVDTARREEPAVAADLLERALALADQPLLVEEEAASWADDVRRAHGARMVGALLAGAVLAHQQDDVPAAVRYADRVLAREPLSEAAWAVKIEALERAGRAAEALAEYGLCRRMLAEELGCAPGPALQAVFRSLLLSTVEPEVGGDAVSRQPGSEPVPAPVPAPVRAPAHGWAPNNCPGRVKSGSARRTVLTASQRRHHS